MPPSARLVTEHILPFLNREVNIGSSLLRFESMFAHNANFSGTVTVPTPSNGTDATTKAYVDTAVTGVLSLQLEEVDGAPAVADARTLRFDQADGFVLTDLGSNVARLDLSGIPVTAGGTGLSSGTSGGVPYFSGTTTLASSGLLTANAALLGGGAGGAPTSLSDPGADRILFWDESANATTYMTVGANLTITDTTISAAAPGVALGDSPTWTGAHVFSNSGTAMQFTGAPSVLSIKGPANPGWDTVWGVVHTGARGVFGATAGAVSFGYNFYNDGSAYKYIETAESVRIQVTDGVIFKIAASGTAGASITYVDEITVASNGTIMGAPTGGAQGTGTLNAKAVYDDGGLLTDHVFDAEYDGRITPHPDPDIDRWQKRFDPTWLDPAVYHARMKAARRLPEMPTVRNQKSLGELVNAIVLNLECQAVHQEKLLKRLAVLEARP